jgi:CRISPR-associated protein Cmr5
MEGSDMTTSNEQKRAQKAWELVERVPDGKKKDYSSLAKSAPVMILTNGLGQTLAFFNSKLNGSNEYALLYNHLDQWLSRTIPWTASLAGSPKLIERVISENSQVYRMATEEALAFLSWIKRFAAARAPEDDSGEGDQ